MPNYNIVAGTIDDISIESEEWLIIDIGYSKSRPTNAIWWSDGTVCSRTVCSMYYRQVKPFVIEKAQLNPRRVLNLTIEAPLSAAFDSEGEPTTRLCDELPNPIGEELDTRHWLANAGPSTLLLAGFLLQDLHEDNIGKRRIKLFEGHVSFKNKESHKPRFKKAKNSHEADVLAIKHEIEQGTECNIFDEARLRGGQDLTLQSPFGFLNGDLIPPVIRVPPPSHFQ